MYKNKEIIGTTSRNEKKKKKEREEKGRERECVCVEGREGERNTGARKVFEKMKNNMP
jgi:hypothetical protein